MTDQHFSAEFGNAAALDGEDLPPFAFGSEDASEDAAGESELANSTAAFGSLLSMGGGARKKKRPSLLLDPDEVEAEARRIQFVGAQQYGCAEEPAVRDVPRELPEFAEVETHQPLAEDWPAVEADQDDEDVAPVAFALPVVEDVAEAEPLAVAEPIELDIPAPVVEPEREVTMPPALYSAAAAPDDFWVFSETDETPVPEIAPDLAVAEPSVWEAPEAVAPVVLPPPPPVAAPPRPQLDYGRPGHSLRARMPQPRKRRTLGHRFASLVRWIARRLARRRG